MTGIHQKHTNGQVCGRLVHISGHWKRKQTKLQRDSTLLPLRSLQSNRHWAGYGVLHL